MPSVYKISTELLKLRRKELELNQSDVASKIGVERSQYSSIETGRTNPSIKVLIHLLVLLGISFEELYGIIPSDRLIQIRKQKISELKNEISAIEATL